LPHMERLLQTCDVQMFWPKVYSTSLRPAPFILQEDLAIRGFLVPERVLPVTPARKAFLKIAEFHAASFFMHHEQQWDFSGFSVGFFQLPNDYTENFCVQHIELFADEVEKWQGFQVCAEKLRKFRRLFFEKGKRETQATAGGFNVLNHGDFHNKNLLVKGSEVVVVSFYTFFDALALNLSFLVGLPDVPVVIARLRLDLWPVHTHELGRQTKSPGKFAGNLPSPVR
jgi:Ecdysteroid kinase-like family